MIANARKACAIGDFVPKYARNRQWTLGKRILPGPLRILCQRIFSQRRANPGNVLDAQVQVRAVSREQLGRRIDVRAGEIDGSSRFGCAGRN